MKKHPELSTGETPEGKEKNIYALAWYMKNKGYKSHKTASGKDKEVQKSHYEPEGQMIGEEEYDRRKDAQLASRGMGARNYNRPARQTPAKPQSDAERKSAMERHKKTSKTALDMVRASIIAKHGKGSLM